jgi:hypothetical protein
MTPGYGPVEQEVSPPMLMRFLHVDLDPCRKAAVIFLALERG